MVYPESQRFFKKSGFRHPPYFLAFVTPRMTDPAVELCLRPDGKRGREPGFGFVRKNRDPLFFYYIQLILLIEYGQPGERGINVFFYQARTVHT